MIARPRNGHEDLLKDAVEDYLRPPVAIEFAKQAVNGGVEASLESGLEMESLTTGVLFGMEDTQVPTAFREDRPPEFDEQQVSRWVTVSD